jgi:hypothetical protein
MEMEKRILQTLELLLARQEEAEVRQTEMLALFRGSTTCHTETTSNPEETEAAVERQELFKE